MSFIDKFLLNFILVAVPLLIYMIYFSTNHNVQRKEQQLFFSLAIFSSYFLMLHYGSLLQIEYISFFSGLIIFFLILNRLYIQSSLLILLNLILYYNQAFLWISYSFIIILVLIREKEKIKDKVFIILFTLFYISSFMLVQIISRHNPVETIFSLLMFISLIFVVYLFYEQSIIALNTKLKYQQLQKEKQIRLSLFKITHEIKNPIAVCKAYLDMYDYNNLEHSKKYIPIIKGEIERLLLLLQDFLLINKNNMNLDIMDVNLLIDEVKDNIVELIDSNHIEFEVETIDDELFINGDYNRLCQVLINILKNSVEAIPNKISLTVKEENNNLCIDITDDGIGIPSDVLEKIYEPFYTTKKCGTGLGVSLSNEIISAHNGTLKYTSEVGSGTNVKITLPTYNEL